MFGEAIYSQTVKTKKKSSNVEILAAADFFSAMLQCQLVTEEFLIQPQPEVQGKSAQMTLSDHLCLDKKFQNLFVVKKITRAMEQIQSDELLQQIAIKSMHQDNPYNMEEQKQPLDTISECEEQAVTGSSAVKTGDLGQKSGSLAMIDSAP